MILRKPYAFLIKHFKLIHLIMTFCMGILIYQTNVLLEFFNDFIGSGQAIVGTEVVSNLFNSYTYLFIVIILLTSLVILVLMIFKNKPKFYYISNMVGYGLLIALYVYAISTIGQMQEGLVDERITRAIRDFLNIIFIFQIYSIFISFIRSIGLDVKKFDFDQDAQDLNITDKDNEEFEVNVEFDSHTLKRKLKRNYRNFKYYLVENKMMLSIVGGVIILAGAIWMMISLFDREVVYNTGQTFAPLNYQITIVDSYITDKDYRLNKITEDGTTLAVVKFKIRTLNKTTKFVFGKLALQLGDNKYYHTNEYASKLTDLGKTYINQNLTDAFQEFLLVYEIPTNIDLESMKLVYIEQVVEGNIKKEFDNINVKISPIILDENGIEDIISIRQNYVVATGILGGYELKLNEFEIGKNLKINYNKCVSQNECYNFYEIVEPLLSGISDKAVLRLNMNMGNMQDGGIGFNSLITQFGSVQYKIGDGLKTSPITTAINTNTKDNNYYFEIKRDVLEAEKIDLVIRVRNNTYRFRLK